MSQFEMCGKPISSEWLLGNATRRDCFRTVPPQELCDNIVRPYDDEIKERGEHHGERYGSCHHGATKSSKFVFMIMAM